MDRKEPLNKAHKRVIRTIVRLRKYDHTNDSYKRLELSKLSDCIDLRFAIFVYDSITNNSNNMFQPRANLRFPIRNSNLLQTPLMNSVQSQTGIRYQGPRVWNIIPAAIRSKPSKPSFKRALRKLFLSNYQYVYCVPHQCLFYSVRFVIYLLFPLTFILFSSFCLLILFYSHFIVCRFCSL